MIINGRLKDNKKLSIKEAVLIFHYYRARNKVREHEELNNPSNNYRSSKR